MDSASQPAASAAMPTPLSAVRTSNDLLLTIACVCAMLPIAPRAYGQDAPPAALAIVDGGATIARDGIETPATAGMPVVAGDRLQTQNGRLEVLFPDGTALDVDEFSTVDLIGQATILVSTGRVILVIPAADVVPSYDLRTLVSSTRIGRAGAYRAAAGDRSVEPANGVVLDAFARWSLANSQARAAAASTQYLPADLQAYGPALDDGGVWGYAPAYGYVWYPRVAATWKPYSHGYWSAIRPYGWTWIGADRWSWPTHHYGRWENAHGSWFWIPNRTWGPAWVSWGISADFVSWCPLGFTDRQTTGWIGNAATAPGWTVIPRAVFGTRTAASRHAVPIHELPRTTAFVVQRTAPPTATQRPVVLQLGASGGVRAVSPLTPRPTPQAVPIAANSTGPRVGSVAPPRRAEPAAAVSAAPVTPGGVLPPAGGDAAPGFGPSPAIPPMAPVSQAAAAPGAAPSAAPPPPPAPTAPPSRPPTVAPAPPRSHGASSGASGGARAGHASHR